MTPFLFTDVQQRTLRTALDRLIPADDFPGAWDAGVGDYISNQLTGQLFHIVADYRAGLDGLEAEAQAHYGRAFAELTAEQQDTLLAMVERGKIKTTWRTAPRAFFSMLVSHAAEGYYADPKQGGNRDRVSWSMLGFIDR